MNLDPDIRRAQTPPASFYLDPRAYELQKERVFARGWLWAGERQQVLRGACLQPWTLLPGCLDEPLLFARDTAGELRCLSNVCTHRGAVLLDEPGDRNAIRCRYHGRCFDLQGNFVSMPGFEGVEGFPSPADDLARVPLAGFGPFLFASLAPQVPFDEWIGPLRERLGWLDPDKLRFDPGTSRDYDVPAHWALYVENFLEGFHVPFVHEALAGVLDWGAYRTETFAWGSLQVGIAAAGERALPLPEGHRDAATRVAAYWFHLWPATLVNVYPWGISLNVLEPLAIDRTRVRFLSFVRDASLRAEGAGADLHRVELEDEAVVGLVQRGIRARLYRRGRYSPAHETGVHHFHRLLAAALGG
jgi:choline monooxygenase